MDSNSKKNIGQDQQDLQDLFFHFPFPKEKENIQSPPAK